jgi:hypothetical protein
MLTKLRESFIDLSHKIDDLIARPNEKSKAKLFYRRKLEKEKRITDDIVRESVKETAKHNETQKSKTIRTINYAGFALLAFFCYFFITVIRRDNERKKHIAQVVTTIEKNIANNDYDKVYSVLYSAPNYVRENTKIKSLEKTVNDERFERIEQSNKDTLAETIDLLRQEKGEKSEGLLKILDALDPNNEEFSIPLKNYREKVKIEIANQRRESEAKREIAERASTTIRGTRSQFSTWDGSHTALKNLIKSNMHDPSSFEHVETKYWTMSDHIVVLTRFRGKNAFGAMVLNYAKAKYDLNGRFIELLTMAAE